MHRSENTILIWVLSWAGLLLALLYSPIGSPDLYRHRNYFSENQGVNFNGSGISKGSKDISFLRVLKNAPKNISRDQNEDNELNVPIADNSEGKKYTYQVSGSTKTFSQSVGAVNISNNHYTSSSRIRELNGSSNTGSTGGGGMSGGSGSGVSSTSGSHRSSQIDSGLNSGGVASTSVDLSVFGDSTVNQINKNTQKVEGQVDSGDSGSVPVPEGWCFLILLAFVYCVYILFKKKTVVYKV